MSADRAEFLLADIVNAIRDDVVVAMQSGRNCTITVKLSHSKIKSIVSLSKMTNNVDSNDGQVYIERILYGQNQGFVNAR